MTRYLLDHPWSIDSALDARSAGFRVLLNFEDLIRRRRLPFGSLVRFLEQQEFDDAKQRLGRHTWAAAILRFSHHLIRNRDGDIRATPIPEPNPPLSNCWKRALRDELEHPENWRNPQIIFPKVRQSAWPTTDEIEINCEDRKGAIFRVFAPLEGYESHKYAIPDLDPWCHLQWLYQPDQNGHNNYPCRLPRPPVLEGVSVQDLFHRLPEARAIGWQVSGRYYFVPPDNYRAEQISAHRWRSGNAFEQKKARGWKGPSPIDYLGQIWRWDRGERHWDVQLNGEYIRISHEGRRL